MASLLRFWHLNDRLKTLAFLLAGAGCFLSFKAGGIPSDAARSVVAMQIGGFVLAAAAVVVALETGNRRQRLSN